MVEGRISLAVNAGAEGVAVARDGGRRGDERKTFKVECLTFCIMISHKM